MTHPLTDEICKDLVLRFYWSARASYSDRLIKEASGEIDTDDMRTAADWQLEQVIAYIIAAEWFSRPERRIAELSKAMRPTSQENS